MGKGAPDPRISEICQLVSQLNKGIGDGGEVPVDEGMDDLDAIIAGLSQFINRRGPCQAEKTMRLNNFAIERSSDAIHWIDSEGRIVEVNEATCRMLGYSREELVGMSLGDIDPVFDMSTWPDIWKKLKTGLPPLETKHRTRDGRIIPVEIMANYIEFEGEEYNCAFARDLTERRKTEETLEMFRYSIDRASDAIFWTKEDGHFSYVNERACLSLGYSLEELRELTLWDIDPDHSKERWEKAWKRMQENRQGGSRQVETMLRRKDGSTFPVEILSTHIWLGDIQLHMSVARDITERKQAEEELRNIQSLLNESQKFAHIGSWALNIETLELTWTDETYRLYGFEPREVQPTFDLFINSLHPDDQVMVRTRLQAALETKHFTPLMHRIIDPGGEIRWLRVTGTIYTDDTGEPDRFLGMVQDITEQKRTAELIEENRTILNAALESMQEGVLVISGEEEISHYNSKFCQMWGIPESLMKSRSNQAAIDYVLPQLTNLEQFTTRIEKVKQTSEPSEDLLHLKDGRLFERVSYPMSQRDRESGRVWIFRDITGRKQAERALRMNSFAVERSSDAVYWLDSDSRIIDVNEAACRMLGYTREELVEMKLSDIDPATDPSTLPEMWERMKEGLPPAETRHRAKDGRLIPVEVVSNYIEFEGKEYSCSFVRDITERKQAEEDLLLNNFAVERSSDAVHWVYISTILEVNEAACQMLGYTREEFCGMSVTNIDPLIPEPEIVKIWEHIKKEGSMTFETIHKAKDGRQIPVEVMVNYIEHEGKELNCCFIRDISERKKAEEAQRMSDFILERSSDAVYWVHVATILDVNEAACRMLGYTHDEFQNMPLTTIDALLPEEEIVALWDQIKKEGTLTFETRHKAKDGKTVPVEIMVNYIEFEGKELNCCFVRDITERKQAQEALGLSNFALERTSDAVYWINRETIVDVNDAACRMLGYTREEFQGMPVATITNKLSASEIIGLWERLKKLGSVTAESEHRAKDGRIVPIEITLNYIEFEGKEFNCAFARDITKRKKAEEALRLSNFALESTSDAVYWIDTGIIIEANEAACRMLGYTPDEFRNMALYTIAPAESYDRFNEIQDRLKKEGSVTFESWHKTKDGRDIPVEVMANYIEFEGKKYNCAFARDITERKKAQEALLLNSFAVERSYDAVYWLNPDSRIADVNEAACRMLGYTREEMIGMPLGNINPGIDPSQSSEMWEMLKKGLPPAETRHRTKDGRLVPVEVIANYIEFEGKEYACSFARDITERKQAQEALHRSEERLRQAVNVGNIGIFDHDHVNDTLYWSPEQRSILGWEPEEYITLEDYFEQIHPDDLERVKTAILHAHDPAGDGSFDEEKRIIDRSGLLHWLSVKSHTSFEGKGDARRPLRTVGAVADITERKRAEGAIRQLNEELEQRVIERTRELEEANEEIRHFAYIVSHDLRSPLVNLKGFASELRYNLDDVMKGFEELLPSAAPEKQAQMQQALNEDIPEALHFIESSVSNMDTFTKAVLRLSRLGRLNLELVEVDTKAIVQKTLDSLAYQIDRQNIEVTIGDLPTITADLMSMEQIFGNILTNAVVYCDPDRPGRIDVSAERRPEDTVFRIQDNGRGIAEEDMEKVFAPFRRAGEQDVPGEGMGLAYVQTLVRRHGGRIWCESELGKGTTFSFTIPGDPGENFLKS
ncbi:MAG: PAS domain S-box protein [Anaerolineae bacterium]|nr:PAS domain S-box protein [Anaerolineae bacterium]